MSFRKDQFEELVRDALEEIEDFIPVSDSAVNLLLGTCAQESHFGRFLRQLGGGPALGVFQMEPATLNDIWGNWINNRADFAQALAEMGYDTPRPSRLVYDMRYAAIMARIHYFRKPDPLPAWHDPYALGKYWKDHYNTHLGRGTVEEFEHNYRKYVEDQTNG